MSPLYALTLCLTAGIEPTVKPTHSPPPQAAGQPERFSRKQGKNRMHIDIPSINLDADRAKLLRLGAIELQRYTKDGYCWIVFTDPEGNEFCLARSGAEPPA
jgi:Glyoxalase-like domain